MRRAKIVATFGPAIGDLEMTRKVITAGVDVARMNLSHGSYEVHEQVYKNIRQASEEAEKAVGILVDLQGPKIRLGKFAEGTANLLITTVVAEEGLDISRANCVIRFDPVQHAVSFVQGRGRAREVDSNFIILSEQEGRSAEQLAVAEQRQLAVAQSFEPTVRGPAEIEKERVAQRTRERGARVQSSEF